MKEINRQRMSVSIRVNAVSIHQLESLNEFGIGFVKLEETDYRGSKDFPSFKEAQAFLRDVAYRHERKLGERRCARRSSRATYGSAPSSG